VAQVAEFADAAVIGSAIVALVERTTRESGAEAAPGAVARFIRDSLQPSAIGRQPFPAGAKDDDTFDKVGD
jgi:tryptophan synthase alpha chain